MTGRTAIAADLVAAYRNADYHVDGDGIDFVFHVGEPSAELDRLLALRGADEAVVITAHNPYSDPTLPEVNAAAHRALIATVEAAGHAFVAHVGHDPEGVWPGEDGLLIFGIGHEAACALARRFGQNAHVRCRPGAAPELVLLR